jgi:hypothetical protein
MVAGAIAAAGYFMGDDLHPAREANPKGFFEGPLVKGINEDLLAQVVKAPLGWPGSLLTRQRTSPGSRWLARLQPNCRVIADQRMLARIDKAVSRRPFAYKDPRFCYTLDAWRPRLPDDTVFVCVFREPMRTAFSLVKERSEAPYLSGLKLDYEHALELWDLMYRRVLVLARQGDWLFIHYDQFLDGSAYDRLDQHLSATVDRSFAEASLKRSTDAGTPSSSQMATYAALCERASYVPHEDTGGERRRAHS